MIQKSNNIINYLKEKILKKEIIIMLLISIVYGIIYLMMNLRYLNFYGYFNDEFYYLDCAKHLAFGYVDHPPFSVFVLFIWTKLFGTSLFSIRFLITLFAPVIIFLTGRIASKLGGGDKLIVVAPNWMDKGVIFNYFQASINYVDNIFNNYAPGFLRVTNIYIISSMKFRSIKKYLAES